MKRTTAAVLAGALLLAVPAGYTLAQGGAGPDMKGPGMQGGQGPGMHDGRGPGGDGPHGGRRGAPSPEMMERMLEGKLAGTKAALKLSAAQEQLWPAVESAVRENTQQRMAMRQQMRTEREQRTERPDMLQRLDTMSERMAMRATQAKTLADALRPLYATLSPEQKDVLRYSLRDGFGHGGGRRAHGGGWHQEGGHRGGHGHGGWHQGRG